MKVIVWMSNGFDSHFTSEHLLKAVIKSLAEDGHEVHILQMNQSGQNPDLPDDLKFTNTTSSSVPYNTPEKSSFVKRYIGEIRWHLSCKKELEKYKDYDALFLQSTTVGGFAIGLARKILGEKAIITFNVQDIFPYNAVFSGNIKKNSIIFRLLAEVQRSAYRKADHVITISEDMKDTLVSDGVDADKVEVVYNWSYQDELFENVDINKVSHMINEDFFNIVYAGNIGVMQNVDILIEAANKMKYDKDVWFHIIGNGIYKDKLEARAKEYGISNISFWPMQLPELAPIIYSAADVNVIPLVKDVFRTALPSKTATCMACRRPIVFAIGKDSKFGEKIIRDTGCPVVSSEKSEELVEAIRSIQNGKVKCETSRFFLQNMSYTTNSRKYAEIITRRQKSA